MMAWLQGSTKTQIVNEAFAGDFVGVQQVGKFATKIPWLRDLFPDFAAFQITRTRFGVLARRRQIGRPVKQPL
jgi:peptide subunit release factor RF-3